VPIPFRDADELAELGAAAFLKLEPTAEGGYVGALFLVNARGEPLEFAYNRIETPHAFLWRAADLPRHARRKLTASLLGFCARTPRLLLCLAAEVGSELFAQDLRLSIPVGRIAQALQPAAQSVAEVPEAFEQPAPVLPQGEGRGEGVHSSQQAPTAAAVSPAPAQYPDTPEKAEQADPLHVFWFPAPPAADSAERLLLERLAASGLLLEPFERTSAGLREAYAAAPSEDR
jgi:hypothetical protein